MALQEYLTNQFLIAMPTMGDPHFFQTVTFVCEHTAEGALGIVINRPMQIRLGEVLSQMSLEATHKQADQQFVCHGGPVQQDRGFVLHEATQQWDSTLKVSERVGVTTSRDILAAIAVGEGPPHSLVALGYAGWDAGQLDREMVNNAWLSVPASTDIIFHTPFKQRWEAAAKLIGIDIAQISTQAGHA